MLKDIGYTAKDLKATMEAMRIVATYIAQNSRCKIQWNNDGVASANTETGLINIPRIGKADYESLMKLRTFVYHEAGHIIETKVPPASYPKGALHKIWNALEDVRMEAIISSRHAGCKQVLQWAGDYFNKINGALFTKGEVNAPLWEALCAMMFTAESLVPSWALSPKAKFYFDTAMPTFAKVKQTNNAMECLELAKEIFDLLKMQIEQEKKEQEEKNKNGKQDSRQSDDGNQDYRQNVQGDSEKEIVGEADVDSESEAPKTMERLRGELGEIKPPEFDKNKSAKEELENGVAGAKDFVEDQLREEIERVMATIDKSYTAISDDDIFEIPTVTNASKEKYLLNRETVNSAILSMSRVLEQALRALARSRKISRLEHGKIDMRRLVEIGKSLSKKVFYDKHKGEAINTAVEIVIDESGSMHRHYEVQLLTIAISETLSKLGVPFEIYGATTVNGSGSTPPLNGFTRTNPMHYKIYKTFGENWHGVKERVLHISANKHHIDGEVVQFAANRLSSRRESRKIIFSLSDGAPCGGQGKDSELEQNLIRVCKEVRRARIEVYGFGIQTSAPARFYGRENFIYLENPATMDQKVFRTFADIITKGRYKL